MTSLKSIMERRSLQVLDMRAMKDLKGGKRGSGDSAGGGTNENDPPGEG